MGEPVIEPTVESVQLVLPLEDFEEAEQVVIDIPVSLPAEKVKEMPQTYVEDTFDIANSNGNEYQEVVIDNNVKVKTKEFITEEELLKSFKFGVKLDRYKTRIEYFKTFKEVLDLTKFVKMNKTYHIDDTTDEVDILIREIVKHFRSKMKKIVLNYKDYQKVNAFFNSLQDIHGRFNHGENAIKDGLKAELEKLVEIDRFICFKIF